MRYFFFIFFILLMGQTFAQSHVEGKVLDKEQQPLAGAMVVLLNAQDSIMEEYAVCDASGSFKLPKVPNKEYLLQISFVGFQAHSQLLNIEKNIDLGTIIMQEEAEMIESVEVTSARIPIKINGDTVEYDAAAFRTRPHDNVEKLLRKMPGIEIERDGTVKAHGEKVDRIMVDGKEFFGDNTQMATKNLPADAVKNVQVYDRKSEDAEFSGVDDGVRKKTLNLKLKEDKKQGFWGNVEAGYGLPDHRYKGNLNLSYFSTKMRLTAIGAINNVNEQAFSFMDYINLMGGIQNFMSGGEGNVSLEIEEDDPLVPLLMGNRDGIARIIGGGLNGNFFLSGKTELNVYYMNNFLNKSKLSNTHAQSIGSNSFYSQYTDLEQTLGFMNHSVNTSLKHKFTPKDHLTFRLNFRWNNAKLNQEQLNRTVDASEVLQNQLRQDYKSQNTGWGTGVNINYRKRFKKKGRTLFIENTFGYSHKNTENNNQSFTNLYNYNGELTNIDSLYQNQYSLNDQLLYGGKVTYAEPLSAKSTLKVELSGSFSNEQRNKDYYDVVEQDKEVLNTALSNLFDRDYDSQKAGLIFQYNKKKSNLSIGAYFQHSHLKGKTADAQAPINQHFYYPLGKLNWRMEIKKGQRISLGYNTQIAEPQIEQLQPIVNNDDPLSVVLGNPNLRPEYQHRLNLNYHLFDQFSFTSLFAGLRFQLVQDKIVNTQTLDEQFRSVYAPINTAYAYEGSGNMSFSTPVKALGIKTSLNIDASLTQGNTFINLIENKTLQQRYKGRLAIENRKKKVVDAIVGARVELNKTNYSINTTLNRFFINHSYFAEVGVTIAEKWDISTDFEYQIYADQNFKNNIYIPMWSAELSRYFLEGNRLKVAFKVYNILDQKLNVQRMVNNETIIDNQVNTLGRYFMLSVGYKITKVGKAEPDLKLMDKR
ncbi:MAG: outer membrane beta-barrel protein [Aureispira sp.]|nr:outer membrane beta-barrel protein [Aureispira sp.]